MSKSKGAENKGQEWNWKDIDSCIVGQSPNLKPSSKIASLDMDDTIITRKSGAKFPKNADDWILLNPKVAKTIQDLAKQDYKIVIFTNQNGISLGKTKAQDIKKKVADIAKQIGVEMQCFVASADDQYRKPGIKMWELLEQHNQKVAINKALSFYCGDAAGRKQGKIKDHSDSDLKFALNVGVEFKTPQNLFLGDTSKVEVKGFNPEAIPETGEVVVGKGNRVDFVQKQMVIFVGSPGSGKSTFWSNYMSGYSRVNRDTLKTKEKCYKVAQQEIKKGNSVIIDNTNPKKEDRKYFIDLAKKYKYKIRCFSFNTSKQICFHNDYQRVCNDKRKHLSGKAGSIPIHSFFKYKEEPTLDEGFYEINQVNFVAKFDDQADREFYKKFSKK